jgi:hypothetical protein
MHDVAIVMASVGQRREQISAVPHSQQDSPTLTPPPSVKPERRRPGRNPDVSPALLPLLRGDAPLPLPDQPGRDDMRPARGIMIGVLISLLFWALMLWVGLNL